MLRLAVLLAVATAASCLEEKWSWEVVKGDIVEGKQLHDPHVWVAGKTDSLEACQALCAPNASCLSCDWAGSDAKNCGFAKYCYFRSDTVFNPVTGTPCHHVAARKATPLPPPPPRPTPNPPLGYQPNLVFILTDDQDTRLDPSGYTDIGSLAAMPQARKLLIEQGSRMSNFIVQTPICCPSRTETFSGRYYHNIGPPNEPGSCMHVNTSNAADPLHGVFGLLKSAGYNVGAFGKVTNDQSTILKLATELDTMDYIDSPLNYNDYDGLTYWRKFPNGTQYVESLDKTNPAFGTTYQTAQIGNRTLRWLDQVIGDKKPFFAYLGPHAPHFPAEPAPWYADLHDDITAPRTPNYNASSPDKPQHIRQNPPLDDDVKCWEDQHMRDRWSTLASVDDLVAAVVDKLEAAGVLDKTYIFYTSDHGYKLGQWRVGTSKQHPYDTDIRIPFMARGPGIKPNSTFPEIAGNVDITPTLLELAAGKDFIPNFVDGKSLIPILTGQPHANWRDHILVEYKSVGTYYNDHSGIWEGPDSPSEHCGTGKPPRCPHDAPCKKCVEAEGIGNGECYFVDSTHSNNWRAIRIMNKQENLVYVEYDPNWEFNATATGGGLQFNELYDLDADPYQLKNLYNETSAAKQTELHQKLATYWQCGGNLWNASTCP
eukprot:m.31809 g.31809  ORF g.31809 m.31809 type:complete len:655 (+) comp9844_c0_seq2:42-2006(+)